MTAKKNILLVGSGAVGTVASLALELSGRASVTSVIRSDYAKVVKEGFTIESVDYGNHTNWRPSRIASSVSNAVELEPRVVYDYIVVCTKVLPELVKTEDLIQPAVTPKHSTILLLQNGIDIERPVAEAFPGNAVLSGVSMIGAINYGARIAQIEHDKLEIGYYEDSGDKDASHLKALAAEFVGIYSVHCKYCVLSEDLVYSRWRKLVYNSAINTICALTNIDTGRAYLSGLDVAVILPAMQEIILIAETVMGRKLPESIDTIMLESDDGLYYRPSMQVDMDKGNPIELEVILGNPLRMARERGLATPILTVVYNLLRAVQFRLLEGRGHLVAPEKPARALHKPLLDPTTLPL